MRNLTRRAIFHFVPSWAVGFLLASLFHSISVLMGLVQIGVELKVSDWLSMIWQDTLGLLPTYGTIIAVALLLAFLVTHFIVNRISTHGAKDATQFILFTIAGGLSFLLMLIVMQPIMNITLIAGARTAMGLAAQCVAGICAGGVYSYLSDSSTRA
ncbi:hypothetical protein [Alteromonas sp. S015]|uniref:hypothetical protein n=1 Tax=Alteromonas sp. S015 TaxID=3117401 RepID=UPI002FE04BE7